MHLMIDLETYDTATTAIVLSIGVAAFDPNDVNAEPTPLFYRALEGESQVHRGRTYSAATLEWWSKQSPEARTVLSEYKRPVSEALADFAKLDWENVAGVWGNGADFDLGITRSLHESFCAEAPWKFYTARCYRTIRAMHEAAHGVNGPQADRRGTHHNALDDAMHQARNLQFIAHYNGWVIG